MIDNNRPEGLFAMFSPGSFDLEERQRERPHDFGTHILDFLGNEDSQSLLEG